MGKQQAFHACFPSNLGREIYCGPGWKMLRSHQKISYSSLFTKQYPLLFSLFYFSFTVFHLQPNISLKFSLQIAVVSGLLLVWSKIFHCWCDYYKRYDILYWTKCSILEVAMDTAFLYQISLDILKNISRPHFLCKFLISCLQFLWCWTLINPHILLLLKYCISM